MSPKHPKMQEQLERTKDNPRNRLSAVHKLVSGIKTCTDDRAAAEGEQDAISTADASLPKHDGCGHVQPKIRRVREYGKTLTVAIEYTKVSDDSQPRKDMLSAEKTHEIFRLITREDAEALGFDWEQSRPDWMVRLPCPSTCSLFLGPDGRRLVLIPLFLVFPCFLFERS